MFERKIIIFSLLLSVIASGKPTRSPSIDPDYPMFTEAKLPEMEGFSNKKKTPDGKKNKFIKSLENSMGILLKLNSSQNQNSTTGSAAKASPSFIQSAGALKKKTIDKVPNAEESLKPVKQSK